MLRYRSFVDKHLDFWWVSTFLFFPGSFFSPCINACTFTQKTLMEVSGRAVDREVITSEFLSVGFDWIGNRGECSQVIPSTLMRHFMRGTRVLLSGSPFLSRGFSFVRRWKIVIWFHSGGGSGGDKFNTGKGHTGTKEKDIRRLTQFLIGRTKCPSVALSPLKGH